VFCDLTTGPKGESFSFDERISDIYERYGPDHQVTRALDLSRSALESCHARTLARLTGRGLAYVRFCAFLEVVLDAQPDRRAMRRRGSNDPFQLVILGPDEPLGLIALEAAARWAWRHRTAFAPFGITLAAFTAAAYAHPHHARYWLATAGITVVATVVLGIPHRLLWSRPAGRFTAGALMRLWEACGIDRGIERAYAATVIAVTGGWLAAAIAAGPMARPLPAIAGSATVILGIPWWFHRRRRAKARVEKTISAWPDVAENAGLAGAEILSVVVDAWGWTARVLLRKGKTTGEVIGKIPVLESNLGLRPGSMRVFADGTRADRFIMRVIENDPHAEPVLWPGPSITSVTKMVEIGVTEDGRPVRGPAAAPQCPGRRDSGIREVRHPERHHRRAGGMR
jgi:DNA segregation ATPase FtsK/SpoIIIE, S-DNA-T family